MADRITSDRNDWTGSDLPRSEKVSDLGKSDSVQSLQSDVIQKMNSLVDSISAHPCI